MTNLNRQGAKTPRKTPFFMAFLGVLAVNIKELQATP